MLFFLYLFFTSFCLISTQTNQTCPNCLSGCDESGSCWNSTCKLCPDSTCIQYYGNNCNKIAPLALSTISMSFTNNLTSDGFCTALISIPPFNTTPNFPDINPLNYYLLNESSGTFNNSDIKINYLTQIPMILNNNNKNYEYLTRFNQAAYFRFAIYFTFEDIKVYGNFNSSISNSFKTFLSPSNCSGVIPTSTTTTTTTTTPTTITTKTTTAIQSIPSSISMGPTSTVGSSTVGMSTQTQTTGNIIAVTSTTDPGISKSTAFYSSSLSPETSSLNIITSTTVRSSSNSDFTVQRMSSTANFTFIVVTWNPPNSMFGFSGYTIFLNSAIKASSLDSSFNTFNLTNLTEGTSYNITVTSYFGTSFYSASQIGTTFSSIPPSNLSWEKSYTYGIIYWNLTATPPPNYFKISVNDSFQFQSGSETRFYNISSLTEAQSYTIKVSAFYYGGQEVGNSILVWTRPYKFVSTMPLQSITGLTANSFGVTFPSYPNYNGSINQYYFLLQKTSETSRQKRDILSCQAVIPGIPGTAQIRFANSTYNKESIVIGSGTLYPPFSCPNDKLVSQTNYTLYTVIGSMVNGTTEYTFTSSTMVTLNDSLSPGAIAGIVIAVLLFIILLVLLVYFLLRYRKNGNDFIGIKGPYEDIKPKSSAYWSSIIDKMQSRKIILDKNNILEGLTFKDEFDSLPPHPCYEHNALEMSTLNHSHEYDGDKVSPYKLECSHYHASVIDGYLRKSYISLQNPVDNKSLSDFWLLVYNENVDQIVMITMEGEIVKPNIYSPDTPSVYGEIEVTLADEIRYAYFVIKRFQIRKTDSKQLLDVYHYHYFNWPADDNLRNVASFLEFHETIGSFKNMTCGPIVVYSQSGCSLNALYIGFDILNDQLVKENEVNVFREIGKLRRFRPNMMISIGQYMMVYDLLFESYLNSNCILNFPVQKSFEKSLSNLLQYSKDFYHLLRLSKIQQEKYNIFDGIKSRQSIILRKSPNPFLEEAIEFWNIVFSKNTDIIVDLINHNTNEMSYISQNFPNYEIVKKITKKHKSDVICVKVQMRKLDLNEIRHFKIYSVKSSVTLENSFENCSKWVEIICKIIKEPKTNLHVFNIEHFPLGIIFVACLNAASKLLDSHSFSLYYTIRSLQSSGHQIINNIDELVFICKFLDILHKENPQNFKRNSDLFYNLSSGFDFSVKYNNNDDDDDDNNIYNNSNYNNINYNNNIYDSQS